MPESADKPSKFEIVKALANTWAKTGVNVALSPYHAIEALMKHGYNPGTEDTEGVKNSANAALNVGILGAPVPKPSNSIGIFGGVRSKNANLDELELAKRLQKEGAPIEELIMQTGWGTGKDGKWRYELPNSSNSQVLYPKELDKSRLPDVWNYPELYQAYPELKDIIIKHGTPPGGAAYNKNTNPHSPSSISINKEDFTQTPHLESRPIQNIHNKKLLGHEGQHGLQDIEGFNSGFNHKILEVSPELQAKHMEEILISSAEHFMELQKYDKLVGRNTTDVALKNQAIQRAMTEVGTKLYKNNAGEVEAMNAMNRINWTDWKKVKEPWNLTEGVPRSQQNLEDMDNILKILKESKK